MVEVEKEAEAIHSLRLPPKLQSVNCCGLKDGNKKRRKMNSDFLAFLSLSICVFLLADLAVGVAIRALLGHPKGTKIANIVLKPWGWIFAAGDFVVDVVWPESY